MQERARVKTKRKNMDGDVGLSQDLQRLGFSDYEARIYLTLLTLQPATAYEVSKRAGLPRSNTYGGLESLTKKGAVQPISENPVRFIPVDPATLFGQVARDVRTVCDRLAETLPALRQTEATDFIWTITGLENINEKISELISGAEAHIWIKAAVDVLDPHRDDLKKAAKRGVDILIILFGTQDTEPFEFGPNCRVYLHDGNGKRIGGADNLFTITSDYKVALTARLAGGEIFGAHTGSDPFVRMAETLIRHDYYLAEIFEKFGDELDEAFGPFLATLRRKMFSADQLVTLDSNLRAAGSPSILEDGSAKRSRKPVKRSKSRRRKPVAV